MKKRVAVLLSGCGVYDGAEINEAVMTLLALDRLAQETQLEIEVVMAAPNRAQYHVINHLSGQVEANQQRNLLVEAARIARGNIVDLATLDPQSIDAVILPGGFGVAKNFSTLALEGAKATVAPDIMHFMTTMHREHKPIGLICIAPAMLSLMLPGLNMGLTIGHEVATAQLIEATGNTHRVTAVDEICYDEEHNVVSTGAFMFENGRLSTIYQGIENLVEKVLEVLESPRDQECDHNA